MAAGSVMAPGVEAQPGGRGAGLPAWFGKLPSEGDFLGRRLAGRLWLNVEEWIAAGLENMAAAYGDDWQERFVVSPLWHFVMNGAIWSDAAVIGCVAPSTDRFGRQVPLVVLHEFDAATVAAWLPPHGRWLAGVDGLVRQAIAGRWPAGRFDDELVRLDRPGVDGHARFAAGESASDILCDLGIQVGACGPRPGFVWPNLASLFAGRRDRSYWWAETSPRLPPRQVIHAGRPDAALFGMLFDGLGQPRG